ncbi:hypothetical protein EJB05_11550 [Eragrostis curvula]|uniref:Major facilitator superfamily (MFS) profile domain-containing protein n=1 Tax=Eragrostis curvula TaxID=38414 RepID=A0A5J9VS04_9POAL|nr:hypothetical protein EJB05_11550 [Eragrostis curvula]
MASAALPEAVEPKKKGNVKYAFTCAIIASMASIILGYDIGVMSGASLYIKKDLKITDVQLEVLMGILNFFSLIGSFAAGRTSDWIGRRFTVVVAAAFFFAGPRRRLRHADGWPLRGRRRRGLRADDRAGVHRRGVPGVGPRLPDVFINVGILLGYVSNYAFARLPLRLGWRVMLGIGAAPSVLLALMVFAMPESPRWLVMKGRLADARAVLGKIADTPAEAAERLADIKAAAGVPDDLDGDVVAVPKNSNREEKQVWKELILSPTPAVRRILFSTFGLQFFQQASGVDSVVLYSPRVFQSAGITDDNQLLATTCAVGVTKTLIVLVAGYLLDRVGRRPLMLCSSGGMAVSLVGLGTGLTVVSRHPAGGGEAVPSWAVGLCVASTLAFVAFFSVGLGPMTAVYTSEIFPLRVRALGYAVGVACNRVTSGTVSMTFLSLSSAITIGGSFFLYAGIVALSWVFFFTCLPETRGRTLEEMGELFGMKETGIMPPEDADGSSSRLLSSESTA